MHLRVIHEIYSSKLKHEYICKSIWFSWNKILPGFTGKAELSSGKLNHDTSLQWTQVQYFVRHKSSFSFHIFISYMGKAKLNLIPTLYKQANWYEGTN